MVAYGTYANVLLPGQRQVEARSIDTPDPVTAPRRLGLGLSGRWQILF